MVKAKTWLPYVFFVALLLLFSIVYYQDNLTLLPNGTHEWAQSDRLSLAINFYDNGMNFWLPATHNQISVRGIVGVEFPLQSYIAGGLGHIFGRAHIVTCFRVLDIGFAWLGLSALFFISFRYTRDFIFSIFTPLFLFCAPTYVFYSGNFLPDAAATSVMFVGLNRLLQYLDTKRRQALIGLFVWMTLAVLMKASLILYLLAAIAVCLYTALRRNEPGYRKRIGTILLLSVGSALLIALNIWHIFQVNEQYHSWLFLSKTNPFNSWSEFNDYLEFGFKDNWISEYFMQCQYLLLLFLIVFGMGMARQVKGFGVRLLPMALFIPGALGMACLFGGQLIIHDYYFLPIFFPLLAYVLVLALMAVRASLETRQLRSFRAGLLVALIFTFFFADRQLYQRHHRTGKYEDSAYASSHWLQDAEALLDRLDVSKNELILVSDNAPNTGLIYSNRKGYNIMPRIIEADAGTLKNFMRDKQLRILLINTPHLQKMKANGQDLSGFSVLHDANGLTILKYNDKS